MQLDAEAGEGARDVDRLRALLDAGDDTDGDVEVRRLKARVVLDHMFQFTGLADLDGTLLEANQTALEAGGIERSDVIGRPVWEAHWFTVSEDVQQRTRRAIAQAVEHGELVRYDEDVYAGTHGTATIPIDFSVRPVLDSDGAVALLVLEGRDIAERKHAQQLKDQLFANVSHELRTPLTLILGRADALLADGLDERAQEAVQRIADNARVLLGKVNDLLHVAALQAGGSWRSATTGPGSPPGTGSGSSMRSTSSSPPRRAVTVAPGWAWRSCDSSSSCSRDASRSATRRRAGPASG